MSEDWKDDRMEDQKELTEVLCRMVEYLPIPSVWEIHFEQDGVRIVIPNDEATIVIRVPRKDGPITKEIQPPHKPRHKHCRG